MIGTDGEIEIPQNGFLSVFLSNRSLVVPVYFDDLRIGITRGKLREENHYYPHGLPMAHMGTEAPGSIENRQKHQGNEYIKDLGLNWMDFAARQYDPRSAGFWA
ncbi:hypothetical protein LWM68_20240 [Niabella sp. W65]|nr:hypothetical protein [Niabella sp. W65]MCH7364886.1 hypothetical protein [Niabella sp. W65]ULT40720.1 hypothetical protein KRR40_39165 [Niabella sp. I65]